MNKYKNKEDYRMILNEVINFDDSHDITNSMNPSLKNRLFMEYKNKWMRDDHDNAIIDYWKNMSPRDASAVVRYFHIEKQVKQNGDNPLEYNDPREFFNTYGDDEMYQTWVEDFFKEDIEKIIKDDFKLHINKLVYAYLRSLSFGA